MDKTIRNQLMFGFETSFASKALLQQVVQELQ